VLALQASAVLTSVMVPVCPLGHGVLVRVWLLGCAGQLCGTAQVLLVSDHADQVHAYEVFALQDRAVLVSVMVPVCPVGQGVVVRV
jgi:hypothetical protein